MDATLQRLVGLLIVVAGGYLAASGYGLWWLPMCLAGISVLWGASHGTWFHADLSSRSGAGEPLRRGLTAGGNARTR